MLAISRSLFCTSVRGSNLASVGAAAAAAGASSSPVSSSSIADPLSDVSREESDNNHLPNLANISLPKLQQVIKPIGTLSLKPEVKVALQGLSTSVGGEGGTWRESRRGGIRIRGTSSSSVGSMTKAAAASSSLSSSSSSPSSRLGPQATNKMPVAEVIASGDLNLYLKKFWVCVFGFSTNVGGMEAARQMPEIRRYLHWYGANARFVTLDRHPQAKPLMGQIVSWRQREEVAAEAELKEKAEKRFKRRVGGGVVDDSSDALEEEMEGICGSKAISAEPNTNRYLYSRSNLTDFGQLFLSPTPIPAVFVNQHYLGGLEDLQMLEKQKKLKDILQFGFEWKTSKFLKPMASQYNDAELFKAKYVGSPIKRPTAMLPQVSTRFNVDDPFEGMRRR